MVPCLFFTLMLGPLGLLMYLGVRFGRMRVTGLEEIEAWEERSKLGCVSASELSAKVVV